MAAASFTLEPDTPAPWRSAAHTCGHTNRGPDLSLFRPIIRGEPTLYLGRDNFAGWELRGSGNVRGFQRVQLSPCRPPERPAREGRVFAPAAVDLDSVDPSTLDSFRYLISPRTAFASQPPANFKVIRKSRWYVLWERRGPTSSRFILTRARARARRWSARVGSHAPPADRGSVRPPEAGGGPGEHVAAAGRQPAAGVRALFSGESLVQG